MNITRPIYSTGIWHCAEWTAIHDLYKCIQKIKVIKTWNISSIMNVYLCRSGQPLTTECPSIASEQNCYFMIKFLCKLVLQKINDHPSNKQLYPAEWWIICPHFTYCFERIVCPKKLKWHFAKPIPRGCK